MTDSPKGALPLFTNQNIVQQVEASQVENPTPIYVYPTPVVPSYLNTLRRITSRAEEAEEAAEILVSFTDRGGLSLDRLGVARRRPS